MQVTENDIALCSEAGRRSNNEDSAGFLMTPDGSACLLVLADGMGGHASGEVASKRMVDILVQAFEREGFANSETLLTASIQEAHRRIREEAEQDLEKHGMGTTVVAAVLQGEQAYIAHVGDSRALQFREVEGWHCVRRLTRDHLFVIESLGMDENVAKHHPRGNVLEQAIGMEGSIMPTLNCYDLQPGDTIALCSDGVSEYLDEQQMSRILGAGSLAAAAAEIVRVSIEEGMSKDNCTFLTVSVPQ